MIGMCDRNMKTFFLSDPSQYRLIFQEKWRNNFESQIQFQTNKKANMEKYPFLWNDTETDIEKF